MKKSISTIEFIALMASLMAINALAVDMILPAFPEIRKSFGLDGASNVVAKSITFYLMGIGLGQIVFGVLSDSYGRKKMLFLGLLLYIIAAILAAESTSLNILLAARFAQGVGASATRVLSMAMVRDIYEGRVMAKIMSWTVALFILFPVIAPQLGQGMLLILPWQSMFYFFALFAVAVSVWIYFRLPETLAMEYRHKFSVKETIRATRYVLSDRYACGYMLVATFLFGGFSVFLSASETIFGNLFEIHGLQFTLTFSGIALVMGIGNLVNAQIVGRYGMRILSQFAYIIYLSAMGSLLIVTIFTQGKPPYILFILFMGLGFFAQPLIFANTNSMAMQNMKPVAGVAAAIIGCISTFAGASLGQLINRLFDYYQNAFPITIAFVLYGCIGFTIMLWVERFEFFKPQPIED